MGLTNTASGTFTLFSSSACASSSLGGCGTIADLLAYNVSTQKLTSPALPVNNFLTFTQGAQSVGFILDSFTITNVAPTGSSLGTTTLSGYGEIDYVGYAPTTGIMTITSQGPGSTSFSGSLISTGTPVPEPSSMLILGAGLVGLGLVARNRRASANNTRS